MARVAKGEKYNDLIKAAHNAEYLDMIDKSIEQINQGKVVLKSLDDLERMAYEY